MYTEHTIISVDEVSVDSSLYTFLFRGEQTKANAPKKPFLNTRETRHVDQFS